MRRCLISSPEGGVHAARPHAQPSRALVEGRGAEPAGRLSACSVTTGYERSPSHIQSVPKDEAPGGREEGQPEGPLLPPADAETKPPQPQQNQPRREMTDDVTTGFPDTCWARRKIKPFISFPIPSSTQVLTQRTHQPPLNTRVPASGCQ